MEPKPKKKVDNLVETLQELVYWAKEKDEENNGDGE